MSNAAAALTGRSGVYRTPEDFPGVQRDLESAGLAPAEVALDRTQGKEAMLEALASAVGAPMATFGANWDALADVLQDLSWRPAVGHVLHLHAPMENGRGDDWAILIEILRDSAGFWRTRGRPFIVFVDGAQALPAWNDEP